jgi:uncharacterized membrane protein
MLDNILGPIMPEVKVYLFNRNFLLPGLGILAFFLLLYLIGIITTNVMGRKLVSWGDRLFTNIPVVKNIYSSSKQLTDAFSSARKGSFRQAVFVEFVPPQGFLIFLPKEKILPSHMTIEEAIKSIMSVGIVTPHSLLVALSGAKPEREIIENLKGMGYLNSKIEGGP